MGKYKNNKLPLPEVKEWGYNYYMETTPWKRVKIFDSENEGCWISWEQKADPFSMIDYCLDFERGWVNLIHVCGIQPRMSVIHNLLMSDKDIRKYIKENWDVLEKPTYSIDSHFGMSGHGYYKANMFTFNRIGHLSRITYEWEETSSGKIDIQATCNRENLGLPIWALVALDLSQYKHRTEKEGSTYKEYFDYWSKKRTLSMFRKRGIKFKFTQGYRHVDIDFINAKNEDRLLRFDD